MNSFRRCKFHAKKIVLSDGTKFDSKLEYNRWLFLSQLECEGMISNLRRQVQYQLIPAQFVTIERIGKRGQVLKPKQTIVERECHYTADFTYTDGCGNEVIEDTKGFKTQDYIIRRKLMRLNGHPIKEVKKYNQPITD